MSGTCCTECSCFNGHFDWCSKYTPPSRVTLDDLLAAWKADVEFDMPPEVDEFAFLAAHEELVPASVGGESDVD